MKKLLFLPLLLISCTTDKTHKWNLPQLIYAYLLWWGIVVLIINLIQ